MSKLDSLTSIIGILLVLTTTIIALMTNIFIGPFIFLLAVIPIGLLIIRGGFKILKEVSADIIFGFIDTGMMTVFAVIGSIWGPLGAVVGAGVGDALTDAIAGFFEGAISEKLREHGIEEARTPMKASLGKMTGCLIGSAVTVTIAQLLAVI
ncbi:MAG: hypothetical protein HWN66_10925 [Candidatus Helarchaeota archaeon]|nr:hypothetical protein [Candidatus Helarchaeota archaeon]